MALLIDEPAVVRRPAGFVQVTGPDRLTYLHNLFTQDVEHATPGTVADFLYLDPKGNARAAGRVVVHAEHVLLITPTAEVAADLAGALEQFKFLLDVAADDRSGDWALASVRGPAPIELSGAPHEQMRAAPHAPGLVIRDRSGGVDLVGPPDWVDARVAGLTLPVADDAAWEAWRISTGVPAWGTEIAPGRRPQELGLLPTHVHMRKGCYPGQESIAKTFNLGKPRRALEVIEVTGPVAPGDAVDTAAGRGEVTSAVPIGPAWVALAMLPADAGDELTVGGVPGRVRTRVGQGVTIPGT